MIGNTTKDNSESYGAAFSLLVSFSLIMLIGLVHTVSALLLLIGQTIAVFTVPLALVVTAAALVGAVFSIFKGGAQRGAVIGGVFITLLVVGFLSFNIAGNVYDSSWDGQDYHQVGIIRLAEGWNPLKEVIPVDISADPNVATWSNHYAKATWIVAANIYRLTGMLEYGKGQNLLLLFASFFACLALFLYSRRFSVISSILASILIAFNPITMYQFFSFYVDGVLSSVVIILLAFGGLLLLKKRVVLSGLAFALMLIFCVNVKFTGVVYGGLVVAGLSIAMLIARKKFMPAFKTGLLYTGIFLAGLLIVGFSPYVTNYQQKGNPLYPVFGEEKVDIISRQLPQNFRNMGGFSRFYHSLFSRSGGTFMGTGFAASRLKVPFTFDKNEITSMGLDTRVAGFGPLFSGVLLTSLVLLAISIYLALRKREFSLLLLYGGFLAWIGLSVFMNSQSWWARYIPQLWLFPLVILLFSFDRGIVEELGESLLFKWFVRTLQGAVILLAVANVTMSANYYIGAALSADRVVKEHLELMRNSKGTAQVVPRRFELAFRAKLKDAGINYEEIASLDQGLYEQSFVFPSSYGGIYCGVSPITDGDDGKEQPIVTPVPEDIEIIKPDPSLPEEIAAFSGRWVTRWSGWVDMRFIVLEVDREKAKILFSWGDQLVMLGRQTGYEIVEAKVEHTKSETALRFTDSDGVEHRLIMGPNLNSMEGLALTKSYESSAYIRREDDNRVRGHLAKGSREPFTGTPLPEDIKVVEPASGLESKLALYSGRWEGYLSGMLGVTVVVESVDAKGINYIISWGDYTSKGWNAGYARERASFTRGEIIVASNTMGNGKLFAMRAGDEPDSMELLLDSGYNQVTAYLRRCKVAR